MKTVVALFLSVAAISCAQDKKAESNNNGAPSAQEKMRLESVTWDLKSHKLVWVVQKGVENNGQFTPSGADRYEISPDDAVMAFANQKRAFTQEEASSLRKLLATLSLYCAESVIWWDQGEGVPLDGSKPPTKSPDKKKDQKELPGADRQKVEGKPAPATVDPDLLVAALTKLAGQPTR